MSFADINPDLILAALTLTPEGIERLVKVMGPRKMQALCNGTSSADQQGLTEEQKRKLRCEAANDIAKIPALQNQPADFKGKKVPLADLYAWVLTGDRRIRNLEFAANKLAEMLDDVRVPEKYRGKPDDPEPQAIQLAIAAVVVEQQREFQENVKLVPKLVRKFYESRSKGNVSEMEDVLNKLTPKYFKGPIAQCYCGGKLTGLRTFFQDLETEIKRLKDVAA